MVATPVGRASRVRFAVGLLRRLPGDLPRSRLQPLGELGREPVAMDGSPREARRRPDDVGHARRDMVVQFAPKIVEQRFGLPVTVVGLLLRAV